MSMTSFVLALSMMLCSGAVEFRRLFMVLSGHVVLIFWHYFTSRFEIDRVNMNLMLCPGLLRTKRCPSMAAHLAQAVDVSEIPSVCSILLNAARMGGSGLVASASDACGAVHQIRNHTYWCADLEEQVTCMACRSPKIDRIVFRAR